MLRCLVKFFCLLVLITNLSACSSYRPILEENEHYRAVGKERSQRDIDDCKKEADEFFNRYKAERAVKEAGRKAVIGGVVGAASGAIWGKNLKSTLIGTGVGAAVGGALGGLSVFGEDKVKPDQMKQRHMAKCLARKGYEVAGWI